MITNSNELENTEKVIKIINSCESHNEHHFSICLKVVENYHKLYGSSHLYCYLDNVFQNKFESTLTRVFPCKDKK